MGLLNVDQPIKLYVTIDTKIILAKGLHTSLFGTCKIQNKKQNT